MEAKEFQKWIDEYYTSRGWAELDIFFVSASYQRRQRKLLDLYEPLK